MWWKLQLKLTEAVKAACIQRMRLIKIILVVSRPAKCLPSFHLHAVKSIPSF